MLLITWTTTSADAGRSPGALASSPMISASRAGDTVGFWFPGGGGVSTEREVSTAMTVAPGNGNLPVQTWYKTHPRLNRSLEASAVSPRACSGAMYAGVPTVVPGFVI
jgi:hypothetical protein